MGFITGLGPNLVRNLTLTQDGEIMKAEVVVSIATAIIGS